MPLSVNAIVASKSPQILPGPISPVCNRNNVSRLHISFLVVRCIALSLSPSAVGGAQCDQIKEPFYEIEAPKLPIAGLTAKLAAQRSRLYRTFL